MLEKLSRAAATTLGVIASAGLFVMMILTGLDVVGRYGFHKSIFGTAEIVEHLMVLTIFAGLAFITARNEHITVTLFDPWIERHFPFFRRWVVVAFSVACYLLIIWQLLVHGIDLYESGKRTAVLAAPQWIQPITATVLSAIGFVLLVSAVVRTRGRLGIQLLGSGGHGSANETSI